MSLSMIDAVITAEEVKAGRANYSKSSIPLSMFSSRKQQNAKPRSPRWSEEEDEFLRNNLGWISESEIAAHLGRTQIAVHIHWSRDLHLTSPSKNPKFITGLQAAKLIGVDMHKISHWCDVGLIPYRNMAANRRMRLILRVSFYRWVVSPSNWIYFDWKEIPDAHLRKLCKLRSKRWGDEWWDTPTVAKLHGVTTSDVKRLIYRRELPAVQVATSRGGRNKNPDWRNWYVLKSDAVKAHFLRGSGKCEWRPTPRAQAWIRKAFKAGWSFRDIVRSMGNPVTSWTLRQYMAKHTNLLD